MHVQKKIQLKTCVLWLLSFLTAVGIQIPCEEHWTGLLEDERCVAQLSPSLQPTTSHVSEVVRDQPVPGWPQKLKWVHPTPQGAEKIQPR